MSKVLARWRSVISWLGIWLFANAMAGIVTTYAIYKVFGLYMLLIVSLLTGVAFYAQYAMGKEFKEIKEEEEYAEEPRILTGCDINTMKYERKD